MHTPIELYFNFLIRYSYKDFIYNPVNIPELAKQYLNLFPQKMFPPVFFVSMLVIQRLPDVSLVSGVYMKLI